MVRAWVVRQPGSIDAEPMVLVDGRCPRRGRAGCASGWWCAGCAGPTCTWPKGLPPRAPDVVPATRSSGSSRSSAKAPLGPRSENASASRLVAGAHAGHVVSASSATKNPCLAPRFTGWDADGGYAEHGAVDERFAYRCATPSQTRRRLRSVPDGTFGP